MGGVVSTLSNALGSAWSAIQTAVEANWDAYVWFYIEIPLAVLGIVDETVVDVQKTSVLIFGNNTVDVIKQAKVKAVISMLPNSDSFFPWYVKHTTLTRAQIRSFYSYAERGTYIHGLPIMEIRGGDISYTEIDSALNSDLGFAATRLSAVTTYPSDEIYFKNKLQATPYFYKPWDNTLTFGGDSTWYITSVVYNAGPDDFTINISHPTLADDTITEPGYVNERSLIVTYHANTNPSTEWFYWIYILNHSTYPGIDPTASLLTKLEMLPVAILRKNGADINTNKTTEEYKTTKRLVDTLGLDIDEIIDNAGNNTNYSYVQDLFINFAVSPSSTHELISKLLWVMFHNIVVVNGVTSSTESYTATFTEGDVNNAMVWTEHVYTSGLSGTLASGQEYEHTVAFPTGRSSLTIKYQVSAGLYDMLVIKDLSGMAAIKKAGYHSMVLNKIGDPGFTIPVSYFVIKQFSMTEQMEVYQYILRLDSYSISVTNLAYYETSGFLTLFKFSMIALTIFTLGSASGPIEVFKQLVVRYLIMELVVYLTELTGNPEFAAVVGLVAMLAIGGPGDVGSFEFATAEGLLNASTNFTNNLTLAYGVKAEELREDMIELNQLAEDRLSEIEDATPEEGPITSEFLVALKSVDTNVFPAVKAQYDFDLLYNYDRIIKDYHTINLMTGVT